MRGALAAALLAALVSACGASERSPRAEPGVLLVTLDTFRADRIGVYGSDRARTPQLDRLAVESALFERAFTPVPSTLPSHCSIMTGAHPVGHGVHDNGVYALPREATTLAERLRESGFATAAFVAAFVLDAQFQLDQGFDVYDDTMEEPLVTADVGPPDDDVSEGRRRWLAQLASPYQRRAGAVTDRAVEWLEDHAAGGGPFFLWVHYFDAHQPYRAPEPWETLYDPDYRGPMDGDINTFWSQLRQARLAGRSDLPPSDHRHMIARYEGEVSYVDAELGRLLARVRDLGLWRQVLVVVVGDHGESFGEHGVQIWDHNATIYDEVLRVPLLVRRPDGVGAGRRIDGLVRTLDVAPTIVDWLGLPGWEAIQGRSLLPLTAAADAAAPGEILVEALRGEQINPAPFSWIGLRSQRFKLALRVGAEGAVEERLLFDLSADPAEERPIDRPEQEAALERRLRQLEAALGRDPAPTRELDRLTSEALEALGYVER